jgi:uncharacterized protein
LGGRARTLRMHGLTAWELGEHFDLLRAINFGLLPSIYFSDDPKEDLRSYAGEYLKEEIAAESLKATPAILLFFTRPKQVPSTLAASRMEWISP